MGKKLAGGFYRLILFLTLFCSTLILVGTVGNVRDLLFRNMLSSDVKLVMFLLLVVGICGTLLLLYQWLDSLSDRQLKLYSAFVCLVMVVVFVVLLWQFCPVPFTDALNLQDTGLYFAKYSDSLPIALDAPHAAYYGKFANNNLLTILFTYFFRLLAVLGVEDVQKPLHIVGAASIMVAAGFMYLIAVKIKGVCAGAKLLTLCALNPVYYLLVFWPYTSVFCLPLMMGTVYFGICLYQAKTVKGRIVFGILETVAAVIGYFIRAVAVFPLVALVVCALCRILINPKSFRHLIKCALPCLIVGVLLFQGVSTLNNTYFSSVADQNFPITHWLMMGSHGSGTLDKEDVAFTKSFETKEEKTKQTLKRMIENYQSFAPLEYASFWYHKLCITWAHGDGADLVQKISQDRKLTPLYEWILGERSDAFRLYCFAYWAAIWFFIIAALVRLLHGNGIEKYLFLFALSLFGGFLFYTFWEAKGTYSAPFIYLMVLFAAEGTEVFTAKIPAVKARARSRAGRWMAVAILGCAGCFCMIVYQTMTTTVITYHDWNIYSASPKLSTENIILHEPSDEIVQEFYAEKPFDRIAISVQANQSARSGNDSYRMELLNGEHEVVHVADIYAKKMKKDLLINLKTAEIVPKGREKFTIRLVKGAENSGKMYIRRRSMSYVDIYDGQLWVNQKPVNTDLYLRVWKEYDLPWCSPKMAGLLNGGLFAMLALLAVLLCAGRQEKRVSEVQEESV